MGVDTSDETITYEGKNEGEYPFDTKIGDNYYCSSMQGFYQWCKKYPEAITNVVNITIENGETLEVGIRKTAAIGSDWVIFDDFELLYLTGDEFKKVQTGVETIKVLNDNAKAYNVAGQYVNDNYKGIVIKGGKKYLNK